MTEAIDVYEDQYLKRLEHRAAQWQVKNPELAKEIRETVTQQFKIVGQPDPEPDSLRWRVFEAAVIEAIRVKAGWPSVREWMRGQNIPAPHQPQALPTRPAVDRHDAKAKAAGE